MEAGYTVLPVNPELVSRRRGPGARRRRQRRADLLPARPGPARGAQAADPAGEDAGELLSIARDDERACRDERRLLNRLRADLISPSPPR